MHTLPVHYLDFQMAPGAEWHCSIGFAAPVGKDSTGQGHRHYFFRQGESVVIDAVVNDQLMIRPKTRPTNFTSGQVYMDTSWVSRQWLSNHFRFSMNPVTRLYRFERYGQAHSCLGVERLLTEDDAMLELAWAFNKDITDILCGVFRPGYSKTLYSLSDAFEMLRLLKREGVIEGFTDEWHDGVNFESLLFPWVGLVVVDNGKDFQELTGRYFRSVTTRANGQSTIFLLDNEDDFFHRKLSMKGPRFLHRERSDTAL